MPLTNTIRRVAWLLAALPPLLLSSDGLQAQQGLRRFTLTATGGPLNFVLPFDESFVLVGAASPELDSVVARVRELSPNGCTREQMEAACKSPITFRIPTWTRTPGVKSDSFALIMPALAPNRLYGLCLRRVSRPSKEELERLTTTAMEKLRARTKARDDAIRSAFTKVAMDSIRNEVVRSILAASGGSIRPASGLDTTIPMDEVTRAPLVALMRVHADRHDRQTRLELLTAALIASLRDLKAAHGETLNEAVRRFAVLPVRSRIGVPDDAVGVVQVLARLPADPPGIAAGRIPLAASDLLTPDPLAEQDYWSLAASLAMITNFRETDRALQAALDLLGIAGDPTTVAATSAIIALRGQVANAVIAGLQLRDALMAREALLRSFVGPTALSVVEAVTFVGTSTEGFKTRGGWYLGPDLGFILLPAPGIERIVPTVGLNVYFRPVNRQVPLSVKHPLGYRFSMTIGLLLSSLAEPSQRQDLFGNQSLLTGFGVRVTDGIRLGGGLVWFRARDPEDEVNVSYDLRATYYLSTSLDWDLKEFIGGLGSLFK